MIPGEATQKHILHSKVSFKTVILFASELLVKVAGMCWQTLSIKIQRHLILFKKRVPRAKDKSVEGKFLTYF